MSKHTPGPWEVCGRGIYQTEKAGGREVVHGNGIKGRENKDEMEANAILLALAPELLGLCQWALEADRALPYGMQNLELQRALESAIRKVEEPK